MKKTNKNKTNKMISLKKIKLNHFRKMSKYIPNSSSLSKSHIKSLEEYQKLYQESITDSDKFWEKIAKENFFWKKNWNKVSNIELI